MVSHTSLDVDAAKKSSAYSNATQRHTACVLCPWAKQVLPFLSGVIQGEDEDDALARGLGVASAGSLSDVQRKYAERVKAKLAQVSLLPFLLALCMHPSVCRGAEHALITPQQVAAAAQAEAVRQRLFTAGKRAYEYGQVTRLSTRLFGDIRSGHSWCHPPQWYARLTCVPCGQYPASVELLRSALESEGPLSPLGGEIQLWLALGLQVLRSPSCVMHLRVAFCCCACLCWHATCPVEGRQQYPSSPGVCCSQ